MTKIIAFNTTDTVAIIVNELSELNETGIILYHSGIIEDIPSIIRIDVCDFYGRLFTEIESRSDVVAICERLDKRSLHELMVCQYADVIYKRGFINEVENGILGNIPYSNTSNTLLDLIEGVLENIA